MPDEVDPSMLTIEHIRPQSQGDETEDEFDVGAIGNLLFINEILNGKVDNKSFKERKAMFSSRNNVYMDEYLKNATTWANSDIAARGIELAEIGYSEIWKI